MSQKDIAKQTRDYVSSRKGQSAIRKALDRAAKVADTLRRKSEVDTKKLNEEINI